VALSVAVIWAAALLTARGRHHLREVFVPLALTAVVALVALIPTLLGSAKSAGTVSSWAPNIAAQSPPDAVGRTLTMAYGGYFDASFTLTQLSLAVLTLGGLVVALLTRRGWVVVAPWALWVAISIDFQMSPASGIGSAIGVFFYRSANRISAHTYVFSPAVVGFGAVAILCWMTDRVLHTQGAEAGRPDRAAKVAVPVLVCTGLALIVFFVTTLVGYAKVNAHTVAQRYSEPQFTRYDMDDRAAVAWLRDNARPGERIMNNANDGSTLAYVEDGLPIINDHSMGLLDFPYTIDLLARFNNYPQDQQIRSLLLKLNIAWVYVDSQAPATGDNAQGRLGGSPYTVAPGLARLTNLPGLTQVFTSGHVSIYHLALGEVSALSGS
jgi:hypothetical protein